MVKHSLKNMIKKYPYFLDSNKESNFYKVTDTYNENFKELYNNLFQVYESFHLNKRILIWKEQEKDYTYTIKFRCNYPNIKTIQIYKNDILINKEEYLEVEEKTNYEWDYTCSYAKTNMLQLKVFKCLNKNHPKYDKTGKLISTECEGIYFGDNLPSICTDCNEPAGYIRVKIYQCNHCGEIYFDTEPPEECKTPTCNNNTNEDYTELFAYKCMNCGEIYFNDEAPNECEICNTPLSLSTTDLYYNDERVVAFDNSNDYSEEIITNDEVETINPYLNNNTDTIDNEGYNLKLPVIPDDKFLFYIETWDEYYAVKGFPENDEYLNDEYDHDYSLDEIGALNNIPRKKYLIIDEPGLLYLTEPPYNNSATEDDYHYMKRMINYLQRLWTDNPASLELWKAYSIESKIINRERYLLKLFDLTKHNQKDTTPNALIEDWTPEIWEHKDKFCDDTLLLDKFFYAHTDNLRPVKWEDVDFYFELRNSLFEKVDYPYVIDIYRYVNGNQKQIMINNNNTNETWSHCTISYKQIVLDTPTTFRFIAHETDTIIDSNTVKDKEQLLKNEDIIGVVDITLNTKTYKNADWYVDSINGNDINGDGSEDKPFNTLNKALTMVRNGYDVIALMSNINFKSPFIIDKSCKILGYPDTNGYVPVLTEMNNDNKFFMLAGAKNVSLKLIDLHLKNNILDRYISSGKWINDNTKLDDYTYVIIRGGLLILNVILDKEEYYPTDDINIEILLTDKTGKPVANEKIEITFDGEQITTLTTDNNGTCHYKLHINKSTPNIYDLSVKLDSETYFSVEQLIHVNATKQPEIFQSNGSTVHTCINVEPCGTYKLYENRTFIKEIKDTDCNGEICFDYKPTEWGVNVIYITNENDTIIYEAIVTTIVDMTRLTGKTFIKNFEIDYTKQYDENNNLIDTSITDVNYDIITIKSTDKLSVLNGILIKLNVNKDTILYDTYKVDEKRENTNEIWYSEALELANAITKLTYNPDNSEITYDKLGDFWED